MSDNTNTVKLLLVGSTGVGKSSSLMKLRYDNFSEYFLTTVGVDYIVQETEIDSTSVKMHIWDTAGQERFRSITTAYYRNIDGILLFYDITNLRSFTDLDYWYEMITEYANSNVDIYLVGNKTDLMDKRCIDASDASDWAIAHNMLYIETSAKDGSNIKTVFDALALLAINKQRERESRDFIVTPVVKLSLIDYDCCNIL